MWGGWVGGGGEGGGELHEPRRQKSERLIFEIAGEACTSLL